MVIDREFFAARGGQVQLIGAAIGGGDLLCEEFLLFEADEDLTQVTLVDVQKGNDIVGGDPAHRMNGVEYPGLGQ